MAERRMFSKQILMADAYFALSTNAQLLYIYCAINADDEGFINNPRLVMRLCDASEADIEQLIDAGYLIDFGSGVIAIRHWLVHNSIAKQRRNPTRHAQERAQLAVDPASRIYIRKTEHEMEGSLLTLDDIDVGKSAGRTAYGSHGNVWLSRDEYEQLRNEYPIDFGKRIERLSAYMASSGKHYQDHLAVIRRWAAEDKTTNNKGNTCNPFLELAGDSYE